MNTAEILIIALILDAVLGEPKWLYARIPHPAVIMGNVIGWAEKRFNQGPDRRSKGVAVLCFILTGSLVVGWVLSMLPWVFQTLVVTALLAHKSLIDHVRAVGDALGLSVADARHAVARIVSRDTKTLGTDAISRSAIESGSENFSDGVIAPAFWFLIAGIPGLLVYKMTNTADSMIGYRTPRFADFGWASAKFDDLLNLIPARLSAFFIAATHSQIHCWRDIQRDAQLHKSPNAGWPESAIARALNIALAGPRAYDGKMRALAWVNATGHKDIGARAIDAACRALWKAWTMMLASLILGDFLFSFIW